jgi:CheY-like chemotaxis protein
VDAIQPAATAKGIAVRVHTEPGVRAVLGDRPRLQQVIWNLLSNAIKFTPAGGEVRVVIRPRGDSQIDVDVTDTGEGIAPDVLPYVFDRFRQGESGTTRTHSGLGLGLAIVRHIVELHGGQVAVESAGRGQGSTFRLSLPVHVEGRPAVAGIVSEAAPPPLSERLAGLRALVVDDDRDARELVTEVLRSRGMEVTTAASADEGLAALDRDVPDIIVSDIAMPEHDGYDLIRRVRQRPTDRGGLVPAVALTAYARPEDTERSLSSGFQLHLAKPVDVDNLVSAVASLAGR